MNVDAWSPSTRSVVEGCQQLELSVYGESDSRGPVEFARPSEVYWVGLHASLDYTEGRGRPCVDVHLFAHVPQGAELCTLLNYVRGGSGLGARDSGLGARDSGLVARDSGLISCFKTTTCY